LENFPYHRRDVNIPQSLISLYAELTPALKVVEESVNQALNGYARERLLPFISRIKTIESAAEKIETGRYRSFEEIDDLVAFTLVVPSLKHEEEATSHCESLFTITSKRDRTSSKKPPDLFRFDATRLYGHLQKPDGIDSSGGFTIYDIIFEIQIRTAFEHAWIVSTHPLTYKTDTVDWKRFRLAAQLKASAEQLDLAIDSFEVLASTMAESPWPEIQQKIQIIKLIKDLVHDDVIPMEAAPKDMSRFAENLMSLLQASKKKSNFNSALNELDTELRKLTAETFPMSASILQVCMGLLCSKGILTGPLQRYTCHVTDQLVQLYPEVRSLSPVFDYGG
jgi:ppGpp synthetase/RelA/SpoT-type nucleotidyltranferase